MEYLRDLWKKHKPDILFLSETKRNSGYLEKFKLHFGYNKLYTVEPRGSSGGLALFYNDEIKLEINYASNRVIDVKTNFACKVLFLSFVYGDPMVQNREIMWERLTRISTNRKAPWFMIGDFNEITGNHEKRG